MLDRPHDTKYVYTKVKQFKPLGECGFWVILVQLRCLEQFRLTD